MGSPLAKGQPPVTVEVPEEFVAEFITNHLGKVTGNRPLLPLKLGDYDLGMWQVVSVQTGVDGVGSEGVTATLRAMWP